MNAKERHYWKTLDQVALLKAKDRVFSINQVLNDDTEPCMTPRRNRCIDCNCTIPQIARYCKNCSVNIVYTHSLYEVHMLDCGCKIMRCDDCEFVIEMHFRVYGCNLPIPQNVSIWKCKGPSFLAAPKPTRKPPVYDYSIPARDNYNWVHLMMPSDYRTR